MAERMVCLSIDTLFDGNHNHPDIPLFISEFSNALYTGDGKVPMLLDKISIGADFPVRLLVGIPQKNMTREKRLISEAYCAMIFGRATADTKGLWTYRQGWAPANPKRVAAPLVESMLDIEYMLSLGIPKAVWRNDILYAPTALEKNNKPRQTTLMRYLFALVAFGFSDPYQFFTEWSEQESKVIPTLTLATAKTTPS